MGINVRIVLEVILEGIILTICALFNTPLNPC